MSANHFSFRANDGSTIAVNVLSTGETEIEINGHTPIKLTNRAAHELRDMLNKRFPNATEVQ